MLYSSYLDETVADGVRYLVRGGMTEGVVPHIEV